jgi:HSP20 family protein
VESAVPKIKKEDFKFDIDRDIIMITPEKDEVKKIEIFTRKEFNYRSFCRLPKL